VVLEPAEGPASRQFVADIRKQTNQIATARHWFGYVSLHSIGQVANQEKSLDAVKLAHGLEGMKLPPEVGLMQNTAYFRKGDHQLMSDVFVGQAHATRASRRSVRSQQHRPREQAAGPVEGTGCTLTYPA